jgi:hypothetical protein
MSRDELSQAIPPAYTEWIGLHLITLIGNSADAAHAPSAAGPQRKETP